MPTRRTFLTAGGLALASLAAPRRARAAGVVEITMRSTARGEEAWFEPIGVRIEPGQTVRWIMASPGNPHTTTAYHPRNANHSLRIPEAAAPWDSGFLVNPRDAFEVTLTVEGVWAAPAPRRGCRCPRPRARPFPPWPPCSPAASCPGADMDARRRRRGRPARTGRAPAQRL
jgi:plastocyanin